MLSDRFTSRLKSDQGYFTVGCYAIMLLAFAGGIYFRLKGLDRSPFAHDEFYIASSVKNILQHGLPQFECGGYYVRGLLLQYLAVPFFKYGSNDEFYFRLITVVFNLLTVLPLYLLARRISGRTVACLVVVLFCLSIWQTEFARFARMYSPFQMLFVWYLYFLYKAIILGDALVKKWMYLISFVSIFVYEGAVFLVLLNFLPFILTIAAVFNMIDFRRLGVESYLPVELPIQSAGGTSLPIEAPVLLISTLTSNPTWMLMFLVPLLMSGIAVWHLFAERQSTENAAVTSSQAMLFSLFITLSLLNMFGLLIHLVILVVLLVLLFNWLNLRQIKIRTLMFTSIAVALTFIFWTSYGIFTDDWHALLDTPRASLTERLLIALFKYPATYSKILVLWFKTMPVLTVATAILILFGLSEAVFRRYDEREGYLLLTLILLAVAIALTALKQPYHGIRYTYFLYPVLLLLVCVSINRLAQSIVRNRKAYPIVLTGLAFAYMAFSEDFGIKHLWNIDSETVIYRTGYDLAKIRQYYPRYDFRSPAAIVNQNLQTSDIVVSTVYGTAYYLRQLDYFYLNHKSVKKFRSIMSCGGKKDLWANANLIHKPDDLLDLLQNAESTVWLITLEEGSKDNPKLLETLKIFSRYRIFHTVYGKFNVYKIAPKKARELEVAPVSPI